MLRDTSQAKNKEHMILLICGIWKWKQQIDKQKLIGADNSVVITRRKEAGALVKSKRGQIQGEAKVGLQLWVCKTQG